MTPDDDPPGDPPQPKKRRKPPKGLEGFDTGFPEEPAEPVESSIPRKPIWTESAPLPAPEPAPEPAPPPPESVVVDPMLVLPSEPVPPTAEPTWQPPPEQPWQPPPPQPFQGFEPLPPQTTLQEAVGAKPKKKKPKREVVTVDYDDFEDAPPRSRKMIVVSILSLVVGLGVAALVFLGRANSAWFYISCEPDKIVAQQGRAFPPWGESALDGKQWAAIKIPADAECIALETEDGEELVTQFRTMLVKRASVLLTAKEVTKTDEANALLEQALLHARSNTDAARNARTEIQRLLGDVVYWRASLKMRDASKALLEAAKQFDTAAQQRPRHVTDAGAWADYVRKVVGELEAGPAGSSQTVFPPIPPPTGEPRPQAPPGVALPVEPDKGSASETPPPADAGLPTGGVLL